MVIFVIYLRIAADVLRRATKLPVSNDVVERSLTAARTEFLPIAEDDALWLARIAAKMTLPCLM